MAKFLNTAGLERFFDLLKGKLSAKQDKLSGLPGQMVGFDADGNAAAQKAVTMEDVNGAIQSAIQDSWEGLY